MASHQIADPHLHKVTDPELSVDRQIEEGAVTQPALAVQPKSDRPDLLRLQRSLGTELVTGIPRRPMFLPRIIYRMSLASSPQRPAVAAKRTKRCPVLMWPVADYLVRPPLGVSGRSHSRVSLRSLSRRWRSFPRQGPHRVSARARAKNRCALAIAPLSPHIGNITRSFPQASRDRETLPCSRLPDHR